MAIRGIFQKLRHGLSKTHKSITSGIRTIIPIGRKIDDDFLDNLEAVLIQADVGVDMVTRVIDDMKIKAKENKIWKSDDVLEFLKSDTKQILKRRQRALAAAPQKPTVFLVCGVNGTGVVRVLIELYGPTKPRAIGKRLNLQQEKGVDIRALAGSRNRHARGQARTLARYKPLQGNSA